MGLFGKKKGSVISDYFKLLEPVGSIKEGNMVEVALYLDHLEISTVGIAPISLSFEKITDVYYGIETEMVNKQKSVIGRAVTGGLLFGGVGAIVGAVSGTGEKQKKVYRTLFVISYTSNGEEKFLQFEDTRKYRGKQVAETLKSACHIQDQTEL